jgi:hypothetical protein
MRLEAMLAACWIIMVVATFFAIFLWFDFTTGGMDSYPRQEWAREQFKKKQANEASGEH